MEQEVMSMSDLYYLGLLPPEYYEDSPKPECYFQDGVLHIRKFHNVANHSTSDEGGISIVNNMLHYEWARDLDGEWKYPVVFEKYDGTIITKI